MRAKIADNANSQLGSTDYNYKDRGHDTCKEFVADVIEQSGAARPATPTADGKSHDPSAAEWGTKDGSKGGNLIPQWRSLQSGEAPQPGDVAAYKFPAGGSATGHSGIVDSVSGGKVHVVASDSKRIEHNGFLGSDLGVVFHRYVGN